MKTKEELNAIKNEVETRSRKHMELSDEDLGQVVGGVMITNHNAPSINTLKQLDKNQSSLSKSLDKLSSGMKINSSADDSFGYQIIER